MKDVVDFELLQFELPSVHAVQGERFGAYFSTDGENGLVVVLGEVRVPERGGGDLAPAPASGGDE